MRRSLAILAVMVLLLAWTIGARARSSANAANDDRQAVDLVVDTVADSFDGFCSDGDCSLRDAVESVPLDGTIGLPSGVYVMSRTGPGGIGEGDIDIRRSMVIRGIGETAAFLVAEHGDRHFTLDGITAHLTLADLTMSGGQGAVPGGGAVYAREGRLWIEHVTITQSRAPEGGGVFVGPGAAARIERSLLLQNVAVGGRGGGVFVRSVARIFDSAFVGNRARFGGAVHRSRISGLVVGGSTFARNRAAADGGAVYLSDGYGRLELGSVTFWRNEAGESGGALAGGERSFGDLALDHALFDRNSAEGGGANCSRAVAEDRFARHNIEDGADSCRLRNRGDVPFAEVRTGRLGSYGGPTPTVPLLAGSDGLDTGGRGCGSADQRGAPRRDLCDAGAYELVRCLGRAVDVVGTPGHDDLSGGRKPDTFLGLAGNDTFQGSVAGDRACAGVGNDRLIGGPGPDRLAGASGDDRIRGEDGDDVLWGGSGTDILHGGSGHDRCILSDRGRTTACEVGQSSG